MVAATLCKQVLKEYPRAVVHLRRQCESKRFGLVLGAGMSRTFEIKVGQDLIDNIASDDRVDGKGLIDGNAKGTSFPYKTELLFQHFRKRKSRGRGVSELSLDEENAIYAEWLQICAH